MTLRFLDTLPSSNPDFPFQPGQIIHLPRLTPEMQRWVKDGRAQLIREEPELATVAPVERAVQPRGKRAKA